jgi:hypothetical protein
MTKTLTSLAIGGLGAAAVCLGLGWSLAGSDWAADGFWRRSASCGHEAFGWMVHASATASADKAGADSGEPASVTLPFEPGDSFEIRLPANVSYKPGPKAEAVVSGDPVLIRHVRIESGGIGFDSDVDCGRLGPLTVRMTGPAITNWSVRGRSDLDLEGIDQKALRLNVSGSARVVASGAAPEVTLHLSGSSDVALQGLSAKSADVNVSGSGKVQLAAQDEADIGISGSAVVTLHGRPTRLRSNVSGSGRIEDAP